MQVNIYPSLEIARYEISLRARAQVTLPPFLGSTLRGAFGHALKNTVCVAPHRDCERCMLLDRCSYPYLFETPVPPDVTQLRGQKNAPHPFILTPPFFSDSPPRTWRAPLEKRANHQASAAASVGSPIKGANAPVSQDGHKTAVALLNRGAFQCEVESAVVEKRQFKAGDTLRFGLTLIGCAIEQLPYVIYAVSEMARRGLGADRGPFTLVDVSSVDEAGEKRLVYSHKEGRFASLELEHKELRTLVNARLGGLEKRDSLKLRFVTPTRIRIDGDLQANLSFELLVRNLLRRISMLIAVHGSAKMDVDFRDLIDRARSVKKVAERLRWDDWERYSNRQQTKMKLGGFMGEVEYEGDAIQEYLPLIVAGELLHVGTGTSFGLGKYEIVA